MKRTNAVLNKRVGRNIRQLREGRGFTQAELARRAKIHVTNVNHAEAGRRNLSLASVARLAKALGVKPHVLLVY